MKKIVLLFLCFALLMGNATIGLGVEDGITPDNAEQPSYLIAAQYREKTEFQGAVEGFERRIKKTVTTVQEDDLKKRMVLSVPKESDINLLIQFLASRRVVDYAGKYEGVWAEKPETIPSCTGEGTKENPYVITNETQLKNLQYQNAAYFKLGNDIPMQSKWMPIKWFGGVLDGNGYSITNLELESYQDDMAGFFLELPSMTQIENLTIHLKDTIAISGHQYMGILAGKSSAKIKNCSVKGALNAGEKSVTGGMVGVLNAGGQIRTSFSDIAIQSNQSAIVGGIAGKSLEDTVIQDSYSQGSIAGSQVSGGICGEIFSGKIERTYSDTTISVATENGIAGRQTKQEKTKIKGSFVNKGKVTLSQTALPEGINAKDANELKETETYDGWDFQNIWQEDENGGLPKLRMTDAYAANGLLGSGTAADPFQIATKYDLDKVRDNMSAYYVQTADIEFTDADFVVGGDFYNDGKGFEPIGYQYWSDVDLISDLFTGKYDGAGYSIQNIYIYNMQYMGVGLFGAVSSFQGLINIHLRGADITGTSFTGGIGGDVTYGNVSFCSFEGNVSSCSYDGVVPASGAETAGIIGGCDSGTTISNCVNYGTINGNSDSAGISGYIRWSYIQDCLNLGTISGTTNVAGITGQIYEYGNVKRCYNIGSISNTGTGTGAVVGNFEMFDLDYDSSVNNYYLANPNYTGCFEGDKAGAYTSLTEDQMKQQSSFVGFDFNTIWTIDSTAEYKYPTLRGNPIYIPTEPGNDGWDTATEISDQLGNQSIILSSTLSGAANEAYYTWTPVENKKTEFQVAPESCAIEVYEKDASNEMVLLNPNTANHFSLMVTASKKYYIKLTAQTAENYTFSIRKIRTFTDGKEFMIQDGSVCYYVDFNNEGKLYKNNTAGTSAEVILNTPAMFPAKAGGYIYYSAGGLCRINVSTKETQVLLENVKPFYIVTDGTSLYYSNWADSGKIYRYNIASAQNEIVCHDEGAWLELVGDQIRYQNGRAGRAIYQISKTATNETTGQIVQ